MIYKIFDSGSFAYIAQNPNNPVNPVPKQGIFCQLPSIENDLHVSTRLENISAAREYARPFEMLPM